MTAVFHRPRALKSADRENAPQNAMAIHVYSRLIEQLRDNPEALKKLIDSEPSETLRTQLRHMTDRLAFAREALHFTPEPLQEKALKTQARRLILNCNRQWGKSTICAIRALHRAWFWPGSLILVVSRAHTQSGGIIQKVKEFLPALGIEKPLKGDGINRISLRFPNGSRIVALPGGERPTRSYSSVAMVIIDEAAMVPDPVHNAVAPTLVRTNGELIMASTPMGKRGAFYRAWQFGGDDWARIHGPVDLDNPGHISKEYLDFERKNKTDDYFEQEYLCQFLDRDSHLFGEDWMRKIFRHDVETWEDHKQR